ncbi:DUF2065 domain-containing protein [Alteromonas sp. ASW11-130]|uniref:DUF2065 domain-containing protein n=1 Tax=Alteromonas sp. ASW11-130 TaxID=3015775 RepID=UPI00224275AC|nr:DUF2065 domain-containing protein [Alteromonas sp. ASW11-130]MCW8090849.1 DUF2065 domain-containing protein [Alteromonas sp. ASW11-130]
MEWIWPALAIVCIIEGLGPLIMPNRWRLYLLEVSQQPTNTLRQIGGVLVVTGVVSLLFLSR